MEDYITRSEFEAFKKQMEQKTEEIKALRVDVHNVDVEAIKQELHAHSEVWLNTLQEHYEAHKHDIVNVQQAIIGVQTVQSGHAKYFEEHGRRLGKIELDVSEIKKMLQQLLDK